MNRVPVFLLVAILGCAGAAFAGAGVGDEFTFAARDGYSNSPKGTFRVEVMEASASGIVTRVTIDASKAVLHERFEANGNPVAAAWAARGSYEFSPAYPQFPERFEPGFRWTGETMLRDPGNGRQMKMSVRGRVLEREHVRVAAGEFDCIRIERDTYLDDADFVRGPTRVWEHEWYSPQLGRSVKYETGSEYRELNAGRNPYRRGDYTVFELTAYKSN